MPRYAAFLRGVMPMNAKMADLKQAFESAGFTGVNTVLGSGNVAFDARGVTSGLEKKAEAAMARRYPEPFLTMVRSMDELERLLANDPYRAFRLAPGAKRIVTFLRDRPTARLKLPIELDGARILHIKEREVFSAYVRHPKGPVFMSLIEKTFGKALTTRTWDTVAKVARA
jgi:uncharacterized protein (DUF1697 family)